MTARLSTALLLFVVAAPALAAAASADPDAEAARAMVGPPAGPALGGERLAARTEEVAALMRCPVCQGLSVADSPTPQALALKGKVERLLAAGYSEEQVLTYFEASYGEFIRLSPKPEGFNLVVWWLPVVMVVVGGWLVARRVRAAPQRAAEDDLAEFRERVRAEVDG